MKVPIKLLSKNAKTPTSTPGNAGYDLYAAETVIILPGERRLVKTDVALEIPFGYYGRIADRSGMAYKLGLHSMAGTIDSVYRGNIGIVLLNTSLEIATVMAGDRPAQIIFEKYHEAEFEEVSELGITDRGDKGYGSSGGLTIQSTTKEKTFQEIIKTLNCDPEDWVDYIKDPIIEDYNNGRIKDVLELFDRLSLEVGDWSPQELLVISEKLNLPLE